MSLFTLLLLLSQAAPVSLDQVKAEPNPEHRARMAVEYAEQAERNAEAAYTKGDAAETSADLKDIEESFDTAQKAFAASHKTPGRNPGIYKFAEMRSRELLIRLSDLERRMDLGETNMISRVKARVQEIHDAWFEGIMGRGK